MSEASTREGETHPTDVGTIVREGPDGPELVHLRWGFEPAQGDEPIINIRAETADLSSNRCLIAAAELILFSGNRQPKRRWRATLKDAPLFFLAGLWREATVNWPESYAVLTIDAAPDLAPVTGRQMAVIAPSDAETWLTGGRKAGGLLKPLPRGSYEVEGVGELA